MPTVGIVIVSVASLIKAWRISTRKRPISKQPMVFYSGGPLFSVGMAAGTILLAIIGSVLIGSVWGILGGAVAFGAFWVLSFLWSPLFDRF
jgi:hypothetical protein